MRSTSDRSSRIAFSRSLSRRPRRVRSRSFRPLPTRLEERTLLSTDLWTGAAGDNSWDTAANWVNAMDSTDHHVPTASDDAVIDDTYTNVSTITITVSDSDSVNSLSSQASIAINDSLSVASTSTITGALSLQGTLSGTGSLTVTGLFTWASGSTITGTGTLDAKGGTSVDTSAAGITLEGWTVINEAAATWTGSNTIQMLHNAAIENAAGASFTITGDGVMRWDSSDDGAEAPGPRFDNAGTLTKLQGTAGAQTTFNVQFNNTGSVAVQQGGLELGSLGVNASRQFSDSSGSFAGAAGTTLGLSFQALSAAASIAGDAVVLSGVEDAGSYSATGGTTATTAVLTGSVTSVGSYLVDNGGLDYSPAAGVVPTTITTGTLSLVNDSNLTGTGNITATGLFTWGPGTTLSGTGTLDARGGMVIDTSSGPYDSVLDQQRTLINEGAAVWTGSTRGIFATRGAVFENLGSLDLQADGYMHWNPGVYPNDQRAPEFINAGTLIKSAGSDSFFNLPFGTTGTVHVEQGTLSLGDFFAPEVSTGQIVGDPGTTLKLNYFTLDAASSIAADVVSLYGVDDAGSYSAAGGTYASGTTFTGTVANLGPSLEVAQGTVSFAPAAGGPVTLTTGALTVDVGGTLTGTDSFVADGPLALDPASTLSTTGTVDAYGGIAMTTGVYYNFIEGTTLNNYAAATWTFTPNSSDVIFLGAGATINNLAGATFTVTGPTDGVDTIAYQDSSAVAFNNAGTFTCPAGEGADIAVSFANTGAVVIQQGGGLGLNNATNTGTVTASPGASLGVGSYTQTAGSTVLNGATVSGGALNIGGGALIGTGTISANVTSGGQVIPGGTGVAGSLVIDGSYTQTTRGTLLIDIGGTTAGSQYSQLAVSGTATLGGTVDVDIINGFQPALGNTFEPLTFASPSGGFGFYNGIVLGDRLILDPALNPTNLTLTVQPAVTTATLVPPSSPSVSGQSVTFTADVTVALPPTTIDPVPTGTVTFYADGTAIGTGTLAVVNGQDEASSPPIAILSTASHQITAAYTSGDSNFIPSPASTPQTQVVNKASTSTAVASSADPSFFGQAVTFTATVSVVSPGSTAVASPTGTVTFYDNGTAIGTGPLSVVNGQDQATLTTSSLSTATHPITAAYTSGDTNFNASAPSTAINQVVNRASTTTTVNSSTNPSVSGQSVTFVATVSVNGPGSNAAANPTGTVTLYCTTTAWLSAPGRSPAPPPTRSPSPLARSRLPPIPSPRPTPAAMATSTPAGCRASSTRWSTRPARPRRWPRAPTPASRGNR
jgi:hypothetical protein